MVGLGQLWTRSCGSGMRRPARSCSSSRRRHQRGHGCGLQPRWPPARHRQPEGTVKVWDVATGQPLRTSHGPHQRRHQRGLQPRWAPARLVEPGGSHQGLGPGRHEPGGSPHARRWPTLGRAARSLSRSRATPARSLKSPSAPTGRSSPRPARMARSRSGMRGASRKPAPSKVAHRGVQPGRETARLDELDWDGPSSCGTRRPGRRSARSRGTAETSSGRGVQPGRQVARLGQR